MLKHLHLIHTDTNSDELQWLFPAFPATEHALKYHFTTGYKSSRADRKRETKNTDNDSFSYDEIWSAVQEGPHINYNSAILNFSFNYAQHSMILCLSVSLKEFRVRWDEMIGLAVWLMIS